MYSLLWFSVSQLPSVRLEFFAGNTSKVGSILELKRVKFEAERLEILMSEPTLDI